jgi:hypothetical protein
LFITDDYGKVFWRYLYIIEKIACKLGCNDEIPNIELAEYICKHNDSVGIKEIVDGFKYEDKAVANDCIKVLYEIGKRNPILISGDASEFISCLRSKTIDWCGEV